MTLLDRIFSVLLFLGGCGHTLGSIKLLGNDPIAQFWALCASLFIFLLAGINLLRTFRPADTAVAWLCLVGGLAWIVASLRFGQLAGNLFDVRAMIFCVITLVLCAFCTRTLLRARRVV